MSMLGKIGDAIFAVTTAPIIGTAKALGKTAYGAASFTIGRAVPALGEGVGSAIGSAAPAIGKGVINTTIGVGERVTAPFSTAEKRRAIAKDAGNLFKTIGNAMVRETDKGGIELTKRGMLLVTAGMTYGKLNDSFEQQKGEGMGTVDRYVTRPTPDYRPKEYEMHPPKRISYDSGGATGDLVFALNRLR